MNIKLVNSNDLKEILYIYIKEETLKWKKEI